MRNPVKILILIHLVWSGFWKGNPNNPNNPNPKWSNRLMEHIWVLRWETERLVGEGRGKEGQGVAEPPRAWMTPCDNIFSMFRAVCSGNISSLWGCRSAYRQNIRRMRTFWGYINGSQSEVKWSELTQSCPTLCDPQTVAYQAPPSKQFSKQEYWTGLPFPSPEDLPNPGIEPRSPALQADALPPEPPGKPNGSQR